MKLWVELAVAGVIGLALGVLITLIGISLFVQMTFRV